MKIAILSGKGGTGKTTISANFAASLPFYQYIDCDVEEPNGSIFLKPDLKHISEVKVLTPSVDMSKCDFCGICAKACQFNAIAVVKKKVLLFPELCHHCGACVIACPKDAITEVERTIGIIEASDNDIFLQGKLNLGEPISIPIINELKNRIKQDLPVILDCPPGASCTVVQSIENSDYCLLVTEPTPFGLHDLKIAIKLVRKMGIPFGVILNKALDNNELIQNYCQEENIEILMEIPFSREIAEGYSVGNLLVQGDDKWKKRFQELYERIRKRCIS
jgi:MinD superfamily P-loop ATPase